MSLQEQLQETQNNFEEVASAEVYATMLGATEELIKSGITDKAPKEGSVLPNFVLPNQNKQERTLDELLSDGNVVLTFYRGGWCPYCNLELRAYQEALSDITAAGAQLIAVSPELPDESLSTHEKNELAFEVLTDKDSSYARDLGIVFTLPEVLRPIYLGFGIDVEKHNGQGQFDLPLAATFIVGAGRKVLAAYVDADYTKRKEPSEVVSALKSMV